MTESLNPVSFGKKKEDKTLYSKIVKRIWFTFLFSLLTLIARLHAEKDNTSLCQKIKNHNSSDYK